MSINETPEKVVKITLTSNKMVEIPINEEDIRFCQEGLKGFPKDDLILTYDCHGIPFRYVCDDCYEKVMEKGYDGEHYTSADEQIESDY
jgi:hypothetical protein